MVHVDKVLDVVKFVYLNPSEATPSWFSILFCLLLVWAGNFITIGFSLKNALYKTATNIRLLKASLNVNTSILCVLLALVVNFNPLIFGPQFKVYFFSKAYLGFSSPGLWLSLISSYVIIVCVTLSGDLVNSNPPSHTPKVPKVGILSTMFVFLNVFAVFFFSSLDIFLLLFTYEGLVLPVLFLILLWGSRRERLKASMYYVFYSMLGSITLFAVVFYV